MEKLPEAKDQDKFESDEIRSQTIEEEFAKLKLNYEQKSLEFRSEIEKLNQQNEKNKFPLSSKQIRSFTQKALEKISETFSSLAKELKLRALMINSAKPFENKILNVDYKKFKSVKKTQTILNQITSVVEYIESENLLILGGPGLVLALDALTLEKIAEISFIYYQLPVLFQYEPVTEVLFICYMNMLAVEAHKYDKVHKKFTKSYELINHNAPGVASLKIINSGFLLTGGYDRKLSIWNVVEKQLVKDLTFNEALLCFEQVSSNIMLIGGDKSIIIFNLAENVVMDSYKVHDNAIWKLIYHSMHQLIISGACDNTVKVSSYGDDGIKILHNFLQFGWSYGICLLDTEHILTCSKDRYLRVYNVLNGKKVQETKEDLQHDGDWITSDPKLKRIFLSETNGLIHIFEEKNP